MEKTGKNQIKYMYVFFVSHHIWKSILLFSEENSHTLVHVASIVLRVFICHTLIYRIACLICDKCTFFLQLITFMMTIL